MKLDTSGSMPINHRGTRCTQVTLDMIEMVFAKADPRVSLLYEEHLCEPELHSFGDEVRR
jgi:phosphoenolpyruvate carboxylase